MGQIELFNHLPRIIISIGCLKSYGYVQIVQNRQEKKYQSYVELVKRIFRQTGWLKHWPIKWVETKVYIGKSLKSEFAGSILVLG